MASLIASGSYACLYLISAFTTLLDCSSLFAEIIGSASRVAEMMVMTDSCISSSVTSQHQTVGTANEEEIPLQEDRGYLSKSTIERNTTKSSLNHRRASDFLYTPLVHQLEQLEDATSKADSPTLQPVYTTSISNNDGAASSLFPSHCKRISFHPFLLLLL